MTFPGARRESENLRLDGAALERARENVRAHGRDHDRPAAHRARIIEQQRHDGVAEHHVLFALVGEREHRIDNDAREPRGIEDAFLEIEFPIAVLLRHQEALQLVRQSRHDPLHRLQLLIEEIAQSIEFFRVAQIGGGDRFVELRGVDAITPLVLMREGLLRPPGLHSFVGVFHVRGIGSLVGLHFRRRFLALFRIRFAELGVGHFGLGAGVRSVAAFFGLGLRFTGFVRTVAFGILGEVVAHLEIFENRARDLSEGLLVAQRAFEPREILARALFDPGTPQIDRALSTLGRFFAGQMLANDQAQCVCQRRFGAVARLGEAARIAARFESGRKIGGDAFHGKRADRFDARLLGRFENGGCVGRLRPQLFVQRIFVIGAAQRIGVACAANDRHFRRRQVARGQGQARLEALESGRLGAEIHFEFRLACKRTNRTGDRALERFGWVFGFHGCR